MTAWIVFGFIAALIALSVGLVFVLPWAAERAQRRQFLKKCRASLRNSDPSTMQDALFRGIK